MHVSRKLFRKYRKYHKDVAEVGTACNTQRTRIKLYRIHQINDLQIAAMWADMFFQAHITDISIR